MVYNEKTKRVMIILITIVMLLTSIPLDVFAINQGEYEEGVASSLRYEDFMEQLEEQIKQDFKDKNIDSVEISGYIYDNFMEGDGADDLIGKGIMEYSAVIGGVVGVGPIIEYFDADAVQKGDMSSFDKALIDLNTKLVTATLETIQEYKVELTEEDIIALLEVMLGETLDGREQRIDFEIVSSENGKIKIKLTTNSGETVYIELKEGITKEDATKEIQTAIQKLINTLNEELKDLSGNEYFEELYGEYIIPNQVPLVYGADGRVNVWAKGVQKEYLQTYEIPNVKDKMGSPIKLPIYGAPFGRAGDGTHRFLGYSPTGDPITNPFFRNDKEANVKFWGRKKFYEPWKNPELKGIMANSKYKVDLNIMPDIDGNDELNPLIWMGLQEYWSGYINDPAEEKNDWINHVKFQIPPTDDTWGLAYFPSMIGSGYWYATIPIPPKSYIGIDIQTTTIVPTPQIATGRDIELKTVYNINDVPKNDKDYRVVISARRVSTPIAILNANRGINHSLFNLS